MPARPRDLVPGKQPRLEALLARLKMRRAVEPRAVDQLHLTDPGDTVDRQKPVKSDPRASLLEGFATSALLGSLLVLKVARRQRPKPRPRLDRPPAQQHSAAIRHNGADDDLRVVVGDVVAAGANQSLTSVAHRRLTDEFRHGGQSAA